MKRHSPTKREIELLIVHYDEHAKKQEENGYFGTVFHETRDKLKKQLRDLNKRGGGKKEGKPKDIQADLITPDLGDE